ncbi:protocadherin gamma-C5-like isoform X1 [Acipenser ruthenus]|uniref:protocadherin gamma-C5-like isoform X1 n=1 Tax=Acipenser ruthenus TaxID=7906 RepID=UPI002741EE0E|nr:protocadherin gamma-C5-like isoform X1 [Acipenser ruthenus]
MESRKRKRAFHWQVLCFCVSCHWICAYGQLKYSVPEELNTGAFVGNIAKDLGLDVAKISERNLRVVSDSSVQYFEVSSESGALVIKDKIDRERICGLSLTCSLHLQFVLQNPLESYRVEVQILDVNDNAPQFPTKNISLEISEAATPGTKFHLERAQDPDVGSNSLRTYVLSPNDCFISNVETKSDGSKCPELVLEKALDREKQSVYNLLLTAFDGGTPQKSGITNVIIKILDVNDNAPVFDKAVEKVTLLENSSTGTIVAKLNASDMDYGLNGEIFYLFSKYTSETVRQLFSVDPRTGEITVNGVIDFEDGNVYDINIQARDKGIPALEGSCNIKVEVIDVNDNAPEVTITSLSSPVVENALPGTVIALISVRDRDSGQNGEVLMQIPESMPFKLQSSFQGHYSLITDGPLDRETVPEYNITVTATDSGSPPLSSSIILPVSISDVNDNAPVFSQPSYTVHIQENNAPGATICSVTAFDADVGKNSQLSYSVLDSTIQGTSVSSYVYINSENGNIYSMRSFDYEQIKVFQIHVQVKDAGIPSLSSNVTVHVFVLDLNDNAPAVVYPSFPKGSALQLTVPRSAEAGYLITKIVAVDPDSGHNAWLSYSIPQSKDTGLFRVATYTGEIRTVRKLQDLDEAIQNLVIVVKDNGVPPLSSSVLIDIAVEENGSETSSEFRDTSAKQNGMSAITLYLIIALASVSAISFLAFIILIVKCLRQSGGHSGCLGCCCSSKQSLRSREAFQRSQKSLHLQLNPDGPIKYVEVVGGSMESQNQYYRSCLSPVSDRSDLMFIQTCSPSTPMGNTNTIDMSLSSSNLINTACEQKPANTDWRFSQGQRPGPSGSQRPEEAGPWPNPPTEAEQLQALMAAANEVSAATATLDAGTMGLSTRYSPQFTLQHVPDYRQNVYIPGSTSTLTGSNSQAEGKNPQPSSGNKKKSGKKEKK